MDQGKKKIGLKEKIFASSCFFLLEELEKNLPEDEQQRYNVTAKKAATYSEIGGFYYDVGSETSLKKALHYYEQSRVMREMLGSDWDIMQAEKNVEIVQAKISGTALNVDDVNFGRKDYEKYLEYYGEANLDTIDAGIDLAIALETSDHTIEAERLLTKLCSISLRTHGPNHKMTEIRQCTICKE